MLRSGTIEEIKAAASKGGGFAKSNIYYVQLPTLPGMSENAYVIGLLCSNIQLPSRQLSTVERNIGVDTNNIVYGYVNPSVNMTFRVLNDQNIREYFETWQSIALNDVGAADGLKEAAFPSEYMRDIQVYQLKQGVSYPVYEKNININLGPINFNTGIDFDLGTKLEKTYKWVLREAYPVSIQYEALSDGSQNTISEFQIEFQYRDWFGENLQSNSALQRGLAGLLGSVIANT